MPSTTYQASSQATTSTSHYVSSKNLPHLPEGMRVPKSHATDSKPLPSNEWQEDAQQMQLMAPGQQGRSGGGRRELQPFHAGASRPNQQCQDIEPPPIFASQPKRGITLKRPTKVQQQIYRMSGGIEPVDLLCNRLQVWRLAIKDMNELFKNMIDVETKAASGYASASKPLEIPFRESYNQFLHSGGIQDVWVAYRNYTMEKSMMHHEYAGYLKAAVVPSLDNIQQDVRNFIKSIEKDPSLRSSILYNSRQEADSMVNQLDNGIKYVHHTPDRVTALEDPTLLNLGVIQSFRTLYNDENNLHQNIIQLQREVATVEQRIYGSLHIITKNWEEFCIEHRIDARTIVGKVTSAFENIKANSDWNEFVRRNQYQLVNEKATYKTDDDMNYPNQNNNLCIPSKVNFLNRKTAFKKWKEGLYVLTPCGYLHGFKNAKHFETDPLSPEISIFLPQTTVSSTDEQAEDLSFQIAGRKKTLGGQKSFVFQANDESDLADWYSEAQRLSQVNAEHNVMEMENVPPALPGMEPHEREEEYATTGVGSGQRLIENSNMDDSEENEANDKNLSTAAVLPESSSTPPLQRKQAKSPLSQQVQADSPAVGMTADAANGENTTATQDANKKDITSTSTTSDHLHESDFIERYNDKLTMDE